MLRHWQDTVLCHASKLSASYCHFCSDNSCCFPTCLISKKMSSSQKLAKTGGATVACYSYPDSKKSRSKKTHDIVPTPIKKASTSFFLSSIGCMHKALTWPLNIYKTEKSSLGCNYVFVRNFNIMKKPIELCYVQWFELKEFDDTINNRTSFHTHG